MFLEKLNLLNFKNYEETSFSFCPQINCFVGENGAGKTNLMDAIYYLCLSKSAFAATDAQNIRHGADFFLVDGIFQSDDARHTQITCALQKGQRKVILSDKKPYERLAEHVGRFPVVLIAPDDTDLVREGSEERRRFFDTMISQVDSQYLHDLLHYNNLLKQRNSLLKQFAERRYFDRDLLESYDTPMVTLATSLYQHRKSFISTFLPVFKKHYAYLSDNRETVDLVYESDVAELDFEWEFKRNYHRDLQLQRTNKGIHKDEIAFEIDGLSLKKFGSQGQQKSFVIALKLAQFEIIAHHKQFRPILLLDDIFDKLDDRRIQKLIQMVADDIFGQLFVTDARPERTTKLFEHIVAEVKIFRIAK